MSDASVHAALRSDAPFVIVEAPAGCGKTKSGADYALDIAKVRASQRLLVLTHTHAACSVFADRTQGVGSRVEIRTIDSVVAQIASAYHSGLGLPFDIASWVRQDQDNHGQLAKKVANFVKRYPMIASSLAHRYGVVICDEHQDSSGDQHSIVMAIHERGAKLRIFGDPMQKIFKDDLIIGGQPTYEWSELFRQAHTSERLDVPYRWKNSCQYLGEWTLAAREELKAGRPINLRSNLPPSVTVVFVENRSQNPLGFQVSPHERKEIDAFEKGQTSLLILTRYNQTTRALRSFFNRRILLWEGHTRPELDKLVQAVTKANGDCGVLASAICSFMRKIGKGFSASAFGTQFEKAVRDGCARKTTGKPAAIQELGRLLMAEPNHRGVAKVLRRIAEFAATKPSFSDIEIDHYREFWDAIRLENYETPEIGLAEITHRRTYSRPKPSDKAISIVHKAKGLECDSTILLHCDAKTFPDDRESRCLLYVALSRATNRLMIVASKQYPSPLFSI